jgi:hypothetical protein
VKTFIAIAVLGMAAGAQDAARSPVPDAADQKRAEKIVRDFFKSDYQSRDAATRSALADKLLKEAAATQDGASVYVLLREARDVAADAGNVATAMEAVALMAAKFDVKSEDLKAAALAAARKKASTPEALARVAEALLQLAEEQAAKGDFDGALRGARDAEASARSARDAAGTQKAAALVKDIPDLKRLHEQFAKAEIALSANPADPDACLACGRTLCLVRGDWTAGLPLLAKGSNEALAAAAMKDIAAPEETDRQAEVADLWMDLAEKERSAFEKRRMQARARVWYEKAAPSATGIVRIRIDKRLADIEAAAGPSLPAAGGGLVDLLRLIDPAKDAQSGTWSFSGKVLVAAPPEPIALLIPYTPPPEYDLTVVMEKKDRLLFFVGLPVSGVSVPVYLDSKGSTFSCIGAFGLGVAGEPATQFSGEILSAKGPSTAVYAVRRAGISVSVDGKKILEYKGDVKKIPPDTAGFQGTDPRGIGIGANCLYHIQKIVLKPVSGQGRPLR